MKRVCLCLPALLAVACAQPRTVVQEVRVPVPVPCPEPALPPRPPMASRLLTPTSTAAQAWKAVLSDIAALQGYAEALEALWRAHNTQPKDAPK